MKIFTIVLIILTMLSGCKSIDDWVFGGARRNAQWVEERHQRLMKLYDLQAKMIEAKLLGNTNITDADLAAINTTINKIQTQQNLRGIERELNQLNEAQRRMEFQQRMTEMNRKVGL